MTYYLLRQDTRREYWNALRIRGVDPTALLTGSPRLQVEGPVHVTISAWGEGFSDFLELPCFVVSDAMRKVLDQAGIDNIDYYPASLQIEFRDEPIDGYWLGNVLGSVACVNRESSTFEPSAASEEGELRGFEVDLAKSHGLSLFRLAEDPRVVLISERVRALLQATTLRGLLLQDTRSYDGYPATSEEHASDDASGATAEDAQQLDVD